MCHRARIRGSRSRLCGQRSVIIINQDIKTNLLGINPWSSHTARVPDEATTTGSVNVLKRLTVVMLPLVTVVLPNSATGPTDWSDKVIDPVSEVTSLTPIWCYKLCSVISYSTSCDRNIGRICPQTGRSSQTYPGAAAATSFHEDTASQVVIFVHIQAGIGRLATSPALATPMRRRCGVVDENDKPCVDSTGSGRCCHLTSIVVTPVITGLCDLGINHCCQ